MLGFIEGADLQFEKNDIVVEGLASEVEHFQLFFVFFDGEECEVVVFEKSGRPSFVVPVGRGEVECELGVVWSSEPMLLEVIV